jgi:hypothetical protein
MVSMLAWLLLGAGELVEFVVVAGLKAGGDGGNGRNPERRREQGRRTLKSSTPWTCVRCPYFNKKNTDCF